MNKGIRKVISMILITSAFLSMVPSKYAEVFSTKVYAATAITADDIDIDSNEVLDLYSSSSCKSSEKLSSSATISEGTSYYTKTSKTRVTLQLNGQDNDKVRIFKGSNDYSNGRSITVDSGTTTSLEIRVYNDDFDSYTSSEKKNSSNYNRYIIKVKNTSSSSSSSNDSSDSVYLSGISLNYGEINFSRSTRSYNIEVPMAIDEIRIKAEPDDDDDDVTIDGSSVYEEDKWRKIVSLNKGENIIKIEVEDDDGDDRRTYTLYIYRGTKASDENISSSSTIGKIDNKQDSIYLDDLVLDDGDTKLNFNQKITSYAIDYKESYEYIVIKADPDDDDYVVRVNGNKVDADNHVKKLYLNKGKNEIKIQVDNSYDYDTDDNDYKKRIYTLTVYRGTSQGSALVTNNSSNNASIKANQWLSINGKWQYNDALGNPLKNMWFFDKINGAWYYLDASGVMKTGWIQDGSGKWYYLYQSGAMAYNTIIEGYKLGPNGDWIK